MRQSEERRIKANDWPDGGGLPRRPLFEMGCSVITANALGALHPEDVQSALRRHHIGDWGVLDPDDQAANQEALAEDLRLFSVYHDRNAIKFYIITEADRSITTVMLPEDY